MITAYPQFRNFLESKSFSTGHRLCWPRFKLKPLTSPTDKIQTATDMSCGPRLVMISFYGNRPKCAIVVSGNTFLILQYYERYKSSKKQFRSFKLESHWLNTKSAPRYWSHRTYTPSVRSLTLDVGCLLDSRIIKHANIGPCVSEKSARASNQFVRTLGCIGWPSQ